MNNNFNQTSSFGQWKDNSSSGFQSGSQQHLGRKRKISETNDKSSDPEIQAQNQSRNRMIAPPLDESSNERPQDLTHFQGRLKNNRNSGSRNTTPNREHKNSKNNNNHHHHNRSRGHRNNRKNNSENIPYKYRAKNKENSKKEEKASENSPENSFHYPPGINYEQPNSTIAPESIFPRHQDTVPHAANSNSPGFSTRNPGYNENTAPSANAYDLSYLPHANSVLRDFDFNNLQYPMHSEFARAALDHDLQQCRTDAEQVQLLKTLLLQSENRARNQLLKYHQLATLNTLDAFKSSEQTKRIKNTLFKYKRIDKQVEENQRLRELINSCCASLDKYNKKTGKPGVNPPLNQDNIIIDDNLEDKK